MTRALAQSGGPARSTRSSPYWLLQSAAQITAALKRWRQTWTRRRPLSDLTQDQLRDIGFDDVPRAVLIVEARLMADLLSMR
jgi:uncharacterized protein YjiS (DUF1127 family)